MSACRQEADRHDRAPEHDRAAAAEAVGQRRRSQRHGEEGQGQRQHRQARRDRREAAAALQRERGREEEAARRREHGEPGEEAAPRRLVAQQRERQERRVAVPLAARLRPDERRGDERRQRERHDAPERPALLAAERERHQEQRDGRGEERGARRVDRAAAGGRESGTQPSAPRSMPTMPSGTLTRKIGRQPRPSRSSSTIAPPTSWPATVAAPSIAPKRPRARSRALPWNDAWMTASTCGTIRPRGDALQDARQRRARSSSAPRRRGRR